MDFCVDNSSRFSRSHSPGFDWPCPYDVGLGQTASPASSRPHEHETTTRSLPAEIAQRFVEWPKDMLRYGHSSFYLACNQNINQGTRSKRSKRAFEHVAD